MADLTEAALNALPSHGRAGLALVRFIAMVGVPLPATMLVLAAGAYVHAEVLIDVLGVALAICGVCVHCRRHLTPARAHS